MKTYPLWFKRLVYRLARHIQRCDEHLLRAIASRMTLYSRRTLRYRCDEAWVDGLFLGMRIARQEAGVIRGSNGRFKSIKTPPKT
jgi:hypothetical protein